jgi:hypothetical protein
MSLYGEGVYGMGFYGMTVEVVPSTSSLYGRAATMLPRLYLSNKQGDLLDDISEEVLHGEVTLDLDLGGAKMSFDCELKNPLTVRPFIDYVAPFLRLVYEDGSIDDEQVGLYVLIPASGRHSAAMTVETLDGRDLGWVLAADQSAGVVNMANGANLIASAIADLADGGITRVLIPPSPATSTKDTSWEPGTSRLERVNDRLMNAGYYTLAFDRHGYAISKPYQDLANAEPVVTYIGQANADYNSMIVGEIDDEPDMNRTANRVVVIGSDPSQEPIIAVRENTDPESPASYANLGNLWLTRTVEDSQLQTQEAVNALADEMIRNGAGYFRRVTLQTRPDPYRQPREVYRIHAVNPNGTVVEGLWHCSGWTLPLGGEPIMVHEVSRVQPLTFDTVL